MESREKHWFSSEKSPAIGGHAIGNAREELRRVNGTKMEAFALDGGGKQKVEVPSVWQQTKSWFRQRRGRWWWSAIKARRALLLIIPSRYNAWEIIISSIFLLFWLFKKRTFLLLCPIGHIIAWVLWFIAFAKCYPCLRNWSCTTLQPAGPIEVCTYTTLILQSRQNKDHRTTKVNLVSLELPWAQYLLKSCWRQIIRSPFLPMMVATSGSDMHRRNFDDPLVIPDVFYAYFYDMRIPNAHRTGKSCAKLNWTTKIYKWSEKQATLGLLSKACSLYRILLVDYKVKVPRPLVGRS